MRDDGFSYEELDDERTINGELVPDCDSTSVPEEVSPSIIEYVAQYKALIDACGQVSYYFNMRKYLAAEVNKVKIIASAYQHDLAYYNDQLKDWKAKAEIAFGALAFQADRLGYSLPEKKSYLNMLTLYKDRRDAYKDYLRTSLKNGKPRSPAKLELDFQKRLKKRLKNQ